MSRSWSGQRTAEPGARDASPTRGAYLRTLHTFGQALPVVLGMVLVTSLPMTLVPKGSLQTLFGRGETLDGELDPFGFFP